MDSVCTSAVLRSTPTVEQDHHPANTGDRTMRYRIALHASEEGFAVSVPGLPGCWSQGATEAEAIENIREAIHDYVQAVEAQLEGAQVREVDVAV
jgi:predicted RNase H-like HicB family nuclease